MTEAELAAERYRVPLEAVGALAAVDAKDLHQAVILMALDAAGACSEETRLPKHVLEKLLRSVDLMHSLAVNLDLMFHGLIYPGVDGSGFLIWTLTEAGIATATPPPATPS